MFSYLDGEPDREQVIAKYKAKKEEFFHSLEEIIANKEESKVEGTLICRDLTLTSEDMDKLADLLKNFYNLTELSLSHNNFGNDGMKALSTIILNNKNIKEIFLEYNDIGNDGIFQLLQNPFVKEKLPFIYIDFSSNNITDDGLIEAAKIMSPLSVLSIPTGNIIKDHALKERIRDAASAAYKKQLISEAEIRKNSRILAQGAGDSRDHGFSFFKLLPKELNIKIAALTGNPENHNEKESEKIASQAFNKPKL